jgi:uncharacterized SAM-binding protein YcdF (DUF218 family)
VKGLAVLLVIALIWAAGLGAFGMRVANSTPADDPPNADGIVALTGAASVRIEAAVQLLEHGKAQRLLVSGVNPDVTRPELQAVAHDFGRAFNCCVDLGFHAANTQGNARETANWVAYHNYKSLIVVTSDYHIPRAMLELHAAMPGVKLYPYPVADSGLDAHHWWRTGESARRMALEYCKYLAILAREGLLHIGGAKRETLVNPAGSETPGNALSTPSPSDAR